MPNRSAVVLRAFGDFTRWKREHGTYQKALDRLLQWVTTMLDRLKKSRIITIDRQSLVIRRLDQLRAMAKGCQL